MHIITILTLGLLGPVAASTPARAAAFPAFHGTSLTGAHISNADVSEKRVILIVTPSQQAVRETQLWARALRPRIGQSRVLIRDVLVIDLPFYLHQDALLDRARAKIPGQYHRQTWIPDDTGVKRALRIPAQAANAYVFVPWTTWLGCGR